MSTDSPDLAEPPALPLAVRLLNRGAGLLGRAGVPLVRLDAERLIAEARRETGLEDLGPGPFEEPLRRLVDSLVREAQLSLLGRNIARGELTRYTRNRLRLVEDRKRHPEIAGEEIRRPWVIVGLPRTGSTILHDILAQDPGARVPRTWECNEPSPPPERASYEDDPRIADSDAQIAGIERLIPGFRAMHPMGARLAQECVILTAHSIASPVFHNQYHVPSYQDWFDRGTRGASTGAGEHDVDRPDWPAIYAFHRAQLQHLQWRCPGERWVLKSGMHMWALEHLLATYPDACVVQTHRDPIKVATSFASLATLLRSLSSDAVRAAEVAADWTPRLASALEHAIDVRLELGAHDARFCDVRFPDLLADPMQVVERIYDHFSAPLSGQAADRMRAFIAANPQGKHGVHRYTPAQYGLDVPSERERFSRYTDHFGIEAEPTGPARAGQVRDL